jgi:hypothetical protein
MISNPLPPYIDEDDLLDYPREAKCAFCDTGFLSWLKFDEADLCTDCALALHLSVI